jgi:hypothetical protein
MRCHGVGVRPPRVGVHGAARRTPIKRSALSLYRKVASHEAMKGEVLTVITQARVWKRSRERLQPHAYLYGWKSL